MTKKLILPLIAIILLSSCASKFGFQKRRYSKGYYFSVAKKGTEVKPHSSETAKHTAIVKNTPAKQPVVETAPVVVAEPQPVHAAEFAKAQVAATPVLPAAKTPVKALTASSSPHNHTAVVKNKFRALGMVRAPQKQGESSSEANLLIMVILCFLWFFNLIPVYIHDGKKLTVNFLITLLLDFTYIFGVIYALLVVLDVVDLSK